MKVFFACGQKHVHFLENGKVWDKNSVVQVEADDRESATDFIYDEFGQAWGDSFIDEEEINNHFPNGIVGEYKA
jgi:hypothetical protein